VDGSKPLMAMENQT